MAPDDSGTIRRINEESDVIEPKVGKPFDNVRELMASVQQLAEVMQAQIKLQGSLVATLTKRLDGVIQKIDNGIDIEITKGGKPFLDWGIKIKP